MDETIATQGICRHELLAKSAESVRKKIKEALDQIVSAEEKGRKIWIEISAPSEKLGRSLARSYIGHFVYENPERYGDAARFVWVIWPDRILDKDDQEHLNLLNKNREKTSIQL